MLVLQNRVRTLEFRHSHSHVTFMLGGRFVHSSHAREHLWHGGRLHGRSSPNVGEVLSDICCDFTERVEKRVRIESIKIRQTLRDLVMARDRFPKNSDLTVLFDGKSRGGLHQKVLSDSGKMFVQIFNMVERTHEDFVHLVEGHLIGRGVLAPKGVGNIPE